MRCVSPQPGKCTQVAGQDAVQITEEDLHQAFGSGRPSMPAPERRPLSALCAPSCGHVSQLVTGQFRLSCHVQAGHQVVASASAANLSCICRVAAP